MADNDLTFTVRVDGERELLLAFDRIELWPKTHGRDLVDFLATHSEFWTRIYAPVGETGGLIKAIDKTKVQWHPGGAGGGGTWEATAGVKPVNTARAEQRIYPGFVHGGTGKASGGFIYAKGAKSPTGNKHPVMTLQKGGEEDVRFRYRVRGQKANPFVMKAFHHTSIYARVRLHTLGREIVRI